MQLDIHGEEEQVYFETHQAVETFIKTLIPLPNLQTFEIGGYISLECIQHLIEHLPSLSTLIVQYCEAQIVSSDQIFRMLHVLEKKMNLQYVHILVMSAFMRDQFNDCIKVSNCKKVQVSENF